MFNELPKLFDRNFTTGYLLPAVLFLAASTGLLIVFGLTDFVSWLIDPSNALIGTALIVITAWFSSIFLIGLNWHIYQFMEGYTFGNYNLFMLLSRILSHVPKLPRNLGKPYKQYFSELEAEIQRLRKQRDDNGGVLGLRETDRLRDLALEQAEHFPHEEDLVLPTRFGNTIRAFEVYSRVMYGIEAIQGWSRLQAVVPDEFLKLVDNAKAETDLWMNLWFLSLLLILEYLFLAIIVGQAPIVWIVIPFALASAWISSKLASDAAVTWGEQVKSSFDIYLPELRDVLGFKGEHTREEEFMFWTKFSQAITYRSPKHLDELANVKSEAQATSQQPQPTSIIEQNQEAAKSLGPGESLPEQKHQSNRNTSD